MDIPSEPNTDPWGYLRSCLSRIRNTLLSLPTGLILWANTPSSSPHWIVFFFPTSLTLTLTVSCITPANCCPSRWAFSSMASPECFGNTSMGFCYLTCPIVKLMISEIPPSLPWRCEESQTLFPYSTQGGCCLHLDQAPTLQAAGVAPSVSQPGLEDIKNKDRKTGRVRELREGYLSRGSFHGHLPVSQPDFISASPYTIPAPKARPLGPLCQQGKKRECELGWGGVSTSWGRSACCPLASQPGFPSRTLRSPGWGWGWAPPVLPSAIPSPQKENSLYVPWPALPRLTLAFPGQ